MMRDWEVMIPTEVYLYRARVRVTSEIDGQFCFPSLFVDTVGCLV